MKVLTRTTSIPLSEIYLDCPLVKGKVVLSILDSDMPVDSVNLLLGNDLAGNLTVPNLVISSTPVEVEPDVNPVAVVTRSQTLKDDVTVQSLDDILNDVMTQGKLVQAQLNDENLTGLHHQAMDVVEVDKSPSFYYDNGLLMRFYRPPKCSSLDSWSEKR